MILPLRWFKSTSPVHSSNRVILALLPPDSASTPTNCSRKYDSAHLRQFLFTLIAPRWDAMLWTAVAIRAVPVPTYRYSLRKDEFCLYEWLWAYQLFTFFQFDIRINEYPAILVTTRGLFMLGNLWKRLEDLAWSSYALQGIARILSRLKQWTHIYG